MANSIKIPGRDPEKTYFESGKSHYVLEIFSSWASRVLSSFVLPPQSIFTPDFSIHERSEARN